MRYLIFILSIFLVLSCSDDGNDENNINTGSIWESHPSFFGSSKIVLNAVSENNRLTLAGINHISVLNSLEEMISSGVASDGTIDYKPIIQNDYVIYKPTSSVGQISINSNYYYKTVDNSQYPFVEIIQLNDLDSVNFNVDDEIFVYSNFMPIAAVNSQDQVLFAVQKEAGQRVCLLDLHVAYYDAFSAECMSVNPEIIATFESTNYSYSFVKAFGENFFVEIDGELKKITHEGELIETGFEDNILT